MATSGRQATTPEQMLQVCGPAAFGGEEVRRRAMRAKDHGGLRGGNSCRLVLVFVLLCLCLGASTRCTVRVGACVTGGMSIIITRLPPTSALLPPLAPVPPSCLDLVSHSFRHPQQPPHHKTYSTQAYGFAAPGPCLATRGSLLRLFLFLLVLHPAPRRLPSHPLLQQQREQQTRPSGGAQDVFFGGPGPGD